MKQELESQNPHAPSRRLFSVFFLLAMGAGLLACKSTETVPVSFLDKVAAILEERRAFDFSPSEPVAPWAEQLAFRGFRLAELEAVRKKRRPYEEYKEELARRDPLAGVFLDNVLGAGDQVARRVAQDRLRERWEAEIDQGLPRDLELARRTVLAGRVERMGSERRRGLRNPLGRRHPSRDAWESDQRAYWDVLEDARKEWEEAGRTLSNAVPLAIPLFSRTYDRYRRRAYRDLEGARVENGGAEVTVQAVEALARDRFARKSTETASNLDELRRRSERYSNPEALRLACDALQSRLGEQRAHVNRGRIAEAEAIGRELFERGMEIFWPEARSGESEDSEPLRLWAGEQWRESQDALDYLESQRELRARELMVRAQYLNQCLGYVAAKPVFESVVRRGKTSASPDDRYAATMSLAVLGRKDEALALLDSLQPEESSYLRPLLEDDLQELQRALREAIGTMGAKRLFDRVRLAQFIALDPQLRGDVLAYLRDLATVHKERSMPLTVLAGIYTDIGDYAQAEGYARQAVQRNPDSFWALAAQGVAMLASGNSQGHRLAVRARSIEPRALMIHVNLGDAYRLAESLVYAKQCYERALALNPKEVRALKGLGVCLGLSGGTSPRAALLPRGGRPRTPGP